MHPDCSSPSLLFPVNPPTFALAYPFSRQSNTLITLGFLCSRNGSAPFLGKSVSIYLSTPICLHIALLQDLSHLPHLLLRTSDVLSFSIHPEDTLLWVEDRGSLLGAALNKRAVPSLPATVRKYGAWLLNFSYFLKASEEQSLYLLPSLYWGRTELCALLGVPSVNSEWTQTPQPCFQVSKELMIECFYLSS